MDQHISDTRQRVLSEIAACARDVRPQDCPVDLDVFLDQYFRNIALADLRDRTPADLAGAALGHLAFAMDRVPGNAKTRIFNPSIDQHGWESDHTIVEVANDDMPFLVDSLGMVINEQEKSYMFPVYAFAYLDPLAYLGVHPATSFCVGYNSMVYNKDKKEDLDTTTQQLEPRDSDGYYYGLFIKAAVDAIFNIGQSSGLFLGVEYQWAKVRKKETANTYWIRNMGGVGIRGGLMMEF